jgi:hypothetical protein
VGVPGMPRGVEKASRIALPSLLLGSFALAGHLLSGCGNLFSCYDAFLVGVAGYRMTVLDKKGKHREIHTTADGYTMNVIGKWKEGDELIVCNAIVTNKTQNVSATCSDFGYLAIWP